MDGQRLQDPAGALSYISPDCCRDDWWRILAAIKSELGDSGYSLALSWSEGGETFNQRDFDATWRSLSGNGIGIATLFHHAKQSGWRSGESRPIPPPPKRKPPPPKRDLSVYAKELWLRANCDDKHVAAHPYSMKKNITWAAGAGRATAKLIGPRADCLIIPMRDMDDKLVGVEAINAEGVKQSFGSKGVLQLGNTLDTSLVIHVVEGWADAVSVFIAKDGHCHVIAAFGIGMMDKAADHFPDRHVIVWRDAK